MAATWPAEPGLPTRWTWHPDPVDLASASPLRRYLTGRGQWSRRDVLAGLVLSGLLAPAGIAYATASGLPPETGLYATVVPLIVYALVGPSPILVIGPDSALTPLVVTALVPFAAGGSSEAIAVAGMLGIIAGAVCVLAGAARFGFVSELLSTPVRHGYLHGIALVILVSQSATLCGFSVSGESLAGQVDDWIEAVDAGLVSTLPLVFGLSSIVLLLTLRRFAKRVPATFVVVVGGAVVTALFRLDTGDLPLVGDLPRGIPAPAVPDLTWNEVRSLLGAGLGIALVSFTDTSVMSRTMAMRHHRRVDANHELVALGLTNIASGFFQGFPVSASASRTPVAESLGARSQAAGVTAAATLVALALFAPAAFRHLPRATLAAIVIVAALSLIDLRAFARLRRARRSEFALAMAGLIGVAVLGPVTGVVVAVGLSVLDFLRRAWKPHTAELVRVDGLKGYHELARHPEGRRIPGLVLYRFDAPLFFANARFFSEDVQRVVDERDDVIRCVVVTAEPITDIDTTAAAELRETVDVLASRGVDLRFAELKGVVRDRLTRHAGFDRPSDAARVGARTVGEAVHRYLEDHQVRWTDWEDRIDGGTAAIGD